MYDIDNWKGVMDTYMGADDPKYKIRDAFTIEEIASLYFDFRPDPTDEINLSDKKQAYLDKERELQLLLETSISTNSFSHSGISKNRGKIILDRYAIKEFMISKDMECPKVFAPVASKKRLKAPSFDRLDHKEQNILREAKGIVSRMSSNEKSRYYREGTGINRTFIAKKVKKILHLSQGCATIRKILGEYPQYWDIHQF